MPTPPARPRRFVFGLEPLRALRAHAELAAMKDLAAELARERSLRAALAAATARITQARAAHAALVTGSELETQQTYVERLEREVDDISLRATAQAGAVEASRDRLERATSARKAFDQLAELRRAAFEQESRRLERIATDEVAIEFTQRFGGEAA